MEKEFQKLKLKMDQALEKLEQLENENTEEFWEAQLSFERLFKQGNTLLKKQLETMRDRRNL